MPLIDVYHSEHGQIVEADVLLAACLVGSLVGLGLSWPLVVIVGGGTSSSPAVLHAIQRMHTNQLHCALVPQP